MRAMIPAAGRGRQSAHEALDCFPNFWGGV